MWMLFVGELRRRWTELLLGALAIAVVVAALVAQRAVTSSAEASVHELAHRLGTNMLVLPAATDLEAFHAQRYPAGGLPDTTPAAILASPLAAHVRAVEARLYGNAVVNGVPVIVVGQDLGWPRLGDLEPAVLGPAAAAALGMGPGGKLALSGTVFDVLHVADAPPDGLDSAVFVPLAAAQRALGRPGEVSALRLGGCWCKVDVATLRVENVTKSFPAPGGGELKALDRVSLRVAPGELVSVVGQSGSGKSTLLFAMGGLAAPTSGEVYLADTRVYALDAPARAALRRTDVGFVFQTFNLVPYLTCLENVALPALLAGKGKAEAMAAADRVLDRLGLAPRRHHRPAQLSVGERQRAGIGRSLVNGPKVLLADEPTGNLDPATADQVMALFRELNAGGQTIVMVTHDPRLAEQASRVVRIAAGAVEEDRELVRRRAS